MSRTRHDTPQFKRTKRRMTWVGRWEARWYKSQYHRAERRLWRGYGRERSVANWSSKLKMRGW